MCSEKPEQPYMEALGPYLIVDIDTNLGKPEITDPSGEVRDYLAPGHHCHVGVHAYYYWKPGFSYEICNL